MDREHKPRERKPRSIFVDTSAWYAYINRDDPDHRAVYRFLKNFHGQLVTSNYVFDELITLVRVRMGHAESLQTGSSLRHTESVRLERVTTIDEEVAWRLFQDRPDKEYSFTDCTSFVLMRRLGLTHALATDEHYRQESFVVHP